MQCKRLRRELALHVLLCVKDRESMDHGAMDLGSEPKPNHPTDGNYNP